MRILEKRLQDYPLLVRIIMWAQKRKYGETLLPAKFWGRSPPLLFGLQVFYRTLDRKSSPLPPSLRSMINVMVSQINQCSFCVDIGTALLQKRGVSMEKILEISNFENSKFLTDQEKIALTYAQAMTRHDIGVDEALFKKLKMHFNDDEIIELTALIGYQNMASKFNAALDIPSQGFCVKPVSIPKLP